MKIETFSKEICRKIREELNPTIEKLIMDKYGIKGSIGNASFTDKTVTFKLDLRAEGLSKVDTQYAEAFGWPVIGTCFVMGGSNFRVSRYDMKKRLKPIIAEKIINGEGTDTFFIFNPEDVNRLKNISLPVKPTV